MAAMAMTRDATLAPRSSPKLESLTGSAIGTPFLACDLGFVANRYDQFRTALRGVRPHYAVKCNPSPEILRRLAELGAGFEVASLAELLSLRSLGVRGEDILFSNTIKPAEHIRGAVAEGVTRFAFDCQTELAKIAQHAPEAEVYVRLRVDDSSSRFPLSRKFGAELDDAHELMLLAREYNLKPYGVTFHVGSQCSTPTAWRLALASAGELMYRLAEKGIYLDLLNLGGGFPARYVDPVALIEDCATTILSAIKEFLPYRPRDVVAEPGRYLVAESAVMVSSVLGRATRAGTEWLYIDVGVYNGLMETQQTLNAWNYPLWTSRRPQDGEPVHSFTVAGPSCDSADTMFLAAQLPSGVTVDDRLFIGSAGAYTLSYASQFNGFPPPAALFVG
jgi:ornithine decarboxylase